MHRITGIDNTDNLLAIAIDQRNLAGITQCHGEDIVKIVVVHLLLWTLLGIDQQLPAVLHFRHTEFRRNRRFVLKVFGHQHHLIRGERAGLAPTRHTGRRTEVDKHFQVIGTLSKRNVRRQRFARRALAQHTMTTRTTLKVDLFCLGKFFLAHYRGTGCHYIF